MSRSDDVLQLYDALEAAPDGLDLHEIGRVFRISTRPSNGTGGKFVREVVRELRLRLPKMDDEGKQGISVPIRRVQVLDPDTGRPRRQRRYVYFLSARVEDGEQWQETRADGMLSRLEVDIAHWQAMVQATDGRTFEGRVARAAHRHFLRLSEDLAEIRDSFL